MLPRKCVFHSRSQRKKRSRTHLQRLRGAIFALAAGRRLRTKHQSRPTASRIANQQKHTRPCGAVGGDFECVYGGVGSFGRSLALLCRWVGWPGGARCSAGHDTWVSQAAFRASKRAAVITTRPPARGSSNYAALAMAAAITAHSHHLSLSLWFSAVRFSGRKYPPREHFPAITHRRALKTRALLSFFSGAILSARMKLIWLPVYNY